MSSFSRGLVAFANELFGLVLVLALAEHPAALAVYFVLHGVASAFAAVTLLSLLPAEQMQRPTAVFVLFFSLNFFLPVLGVIGTLGTAVLARLGSVPRMNLRLRLHAAPRYEIQAEERASPRTRRGVRVRLTDAAGPAEARLSALLSAQAMPARAANPLIREMLSDPSEDVRLIAYGILDTREKTINARIHALARLLPQAQGARRAAIEKQLAELYCELMYQGLVQGDLRAHAAAQARAHVEQALAINGDDPALHALLGRIALRSGDYDTAERALGIERLRGRPEARMLPYLAELGFRRRRLDQVRIVAGLLAGKPATERVERVMKYWRAA
ncbi:MAG TPA: tetratricopeptide repeat protein [Burkholderiales bacterium]|nr:tetratricopeptide repeat protein [Burkholderiales bacterium]